MSRHARGSAVVLGAGITGLCTARVLRDHYDRVILIERDALADTTDPRKLLPQSAFVHVMLAQGQRLMDGWFPGLQAAMDALDAPTMDWAADTAVYHCGNWMPRFRSTLHVRPSTRGALELVLRRELQKHENVQIVDQCRATGLLGTASRITGVRLEKRDPQTSEWHAADDLHADLLVDTMGRSSFARRWLEALGLPPITSTEIRPATAYATRIFKQPKRTFNWKCLYLLQHGVELPRSGIIWPLEGGRWGVNLIANHGVPAPDAAHFQEFARQLVRPDLADALEDAEPVSDVRQMRTTTNYRVHFESASRWPAGFLVLGDSTCAPNPVFGQGMSLASLGVDTLQKLLDARRELDGLHFQRELAKVQEGAWQMCAIEDLRWPSTQGPNRDWKTRAAIGWTDRLHTAAQGDMRLYRVLADVIHLVQPPTALLRPDLVARTLVHHKDAPPTASGPNLAPMA